jgi:hypothetical protein
MGIFSEIDDPILLRFGLSREEFDELFPSYYPPTHLVKTPVVISQLRSRGYDATDGFMISLFRAIKRDHPKEWQVIDRMLRPDGGKDFAWSRELIDDLADHMERSRSFTPSGTAAMLDGYRLADRIRLTRRYESHPGADDVILTITPGLPEIGLPATLEGRRMTGAEIAARDKAAKQLAKKSKRKE